MQVTIIEDNNFHCHKNISKEKPNDKYTFWGLYVGNKHS